MHKYLRVFLIIVFISCTLSIVNAGLSDDVSSSVAKSGDIFLVKLVNGFIYTSVSSEYGVGDSYENSSIALDAIFTVATYTPNPFAFTFLDELRDHIRTMYIDLWWLLVQLGVAGFLVMFLLSRNTFSLVYEATGFDIATNLKRVFLIVVGGFFVLAFELAFVWIVLTLCNELTKSMMMGSLNAIVFTPDNLSLYLSMGVAYALLGLCFEYRGLVIIFFSVVSYLFGALLLHPSTQEWAINAHLYFIQIVIFQFAIVLWYTFCIVCINYIPGTGYGTYTIMILASVYMSYKFIFKLDFVRMAGQVTRVALIKKL